jgi:hypothetical protein
VGVGSLPLQHLPEEGAGGFGIVGIGERVHGGDHRPDLRA